MFINSNYAAKLSPTIQENWLVQIFKNNNANYQTTNTPDLAFSFSNTIYNNIDYYPAILNKPTVSYSLDLKNFTTKTSNVTLNIANIDIDGTTLLEQLGNLYINAHVNILSQIDNDNTAANALQIFSGKISSFAYRNNTIVINIISVRPFQNVSLPQVKTTGDFSGFDIPYVLGDYAQSSGSSLSKQIYDVYKVPFIRNDNNNLVFLLPNKIADNTTSLASLEFYDKNVQRFIALNKTGFSSTTTAKRLDVSSAAGGTTVEVNSQLVKDFNVLPNDFTDHNENENSMYSSSLLQTSTLRNPANVLDLNTDGSINNTSFATLSNRLNPATDSTNEDVAGSSIFLKFPKPMHKLTGFIINIRYSITFTGNSGHSGIKLYMHSDDLSSDNNIADLTNAVFFEGGLSSIQKNNVSVVTKTLTLNQTQFDDIFKNGQIQDRLRLSFQLTSDEVSQGQYDDFTCDLKIYSIFATYTTALTTTTETIAKQESNSNVEELFLAQDIKTGDFNGHTDINNDLNNPVSIHRQIIKDFAGINSASGNTDNLNNGYKTVAELRDSNTASSTTHWKTRLALYEPQSIEKVMQQLQYEGCFFFQPSPQAQQASTIAGVSTIRYFTIENSVNANVDLSQNDISGYELSITAAQDLETNIVVNYKPHPAESKYEKQDTFLASTHNDIFSNDTIQKQEINLDLLYDAVDDVVGSRNTSWINFRKSLFGDYKTIVNTTLVNPEKYAMLQIGDYIDFGEILFSELGSPFNEISDTFDSFVAMPTRLFSEAWSGKKFIITSLKRKVGQVDVQCREV